MQCDQIDARAVESDAKSKYRHDEGRPHDARTVDAAYVGRRHIIANSRRTSNPRRQYRATAGPLSGRTPETGRRTRVCGKRDLRQIPSLPIDSPADVKRFLFPYHIVIVVSGCPGMRRTHSHSIVLRDLNALNYNANFSVRGEEPSRRSVRNSCF